MAHSTKKPPKGREQQEKPVLRRHANGQWCKFINGRRWYFGKDLDEAIRRYADEVEDIKAGRDPRLGGPSDHSSTTLADACNLYLDYCDSKRNRGDLSAATFVGYKKHLVRLVEHFGRRVRLSALTAADLEGYATSLEGLAPVTQANFLRSFRQVLKWSEETGILTEPIRYRLALASPSKRAIRRAKQAKQEAGGHKHLEPDEFWRIYDEADTQFKAIMLLAINCGLSNSDIGTIQLGHINLETGWLDQPRHKTGTSRHNPLWPETIAAINAWLKSRPQLDGELGKLLFITKQNNSWFSNAHNPVSARFGRLKRLAGVTRGNASFYSLRHTLSVIGHTRRPVDPAAIDCLMGHVTDSVRDGYAGRPDDERLISVSDHVREWLFGARKEGQS